MNLLSMSLQQKALGILMHKTNCLLEEIKKVQIRQQSDQIFYYGSTWFSMYGTIKLICMCNELGKQPSENCSNKRSIYTTH